MLGTLLTQKAQETPEKPALIACSRRLSYSEFDAQARALARGLLSLGIQPGDRVAFHLPNSIETALVYFACFQAGLVAVPWRKQLKSDEIGFVLEHSQARSCVTHPAFYEEIVAARPKLPALEHIVLVNQESPRHEVVRFEALLAQTIRRSPTPVPDKASAAILYTSGTTAQPKGILHTHRSLWHSVRLYAEVVELRPDERILLLSPMIHITGLLQLLVTVFIGGTAIIVPPLDPVAALEAIEQEGCTHMLTVPVAYHFLLREQERAPRRINTIRSAVGSGDSVPVALIQTFQSAFGVPILEGHGMTECSPNIVNTRVSLRPGAMGRPLPGGEARVEAAPGEVGELLLRTPAMFAGYWRDEQTTERAFQNGFLRTGDLARVDEDGFFWFAGRRKEIIIHGGTNVSPQEVEDVLCRHPAVAQAGIIGVPDATWGESVCAVVVLKDKAAVTSTELRAFLLERLADWKVPDSVHFEQELPIGPTGKVHRRLLRERVLEKYMK